LSTANQWAPPVWKYYKKHLPPDARTKGWGQLVRETGESGHKGYYHTDLRGEIEALETLALESAIRLGRLLSEVWPKRYYWFEFDRIIGASRGEETRFVLVEHHQCGDFHGHPVTWEELKKRGARDDDRRVE
jgi:hypothetical protein